MVLDEWADFGASRSKAQGHCPLAPRGWTSTYLSEMGFHFLEKILFVSPGLYCTDLLTKKELPTLLCLPPEPYALQGKTLPGTPQLQPENLLDMPPGTGGQWPLNTQPSNLVQFHSSQEDSSIFHLRQQSPHLPIVLGTPPPIRGWVEHSH